MLKNPTHRNKICEEKARWILLCRLARTWGKGWNKTERSMWDSIGPPIKLQMRLLQFYKKNEQTHGKGRVNRSVWLVGRGGPRQWVAGLAANELGVKIVRWMWWGFFNHQSWRNNVITKSMRTHGTGQVNRLAWSMGRGGQRQWVVGLATNKLGVKIVKWMEWGFFNQRSWRNSIITTKHEDSQNGAGE